MCLAIWSGRGITGASLLVSHHCPVGPAAGRTMENRRENAHLRGTRQQCRRGSPEAQAVGCRAGPGFRPPCPAQARRDPLQSSPSHCASVARGVPPCAGHHRAFHVRGSSSGGLEGTTYAPPAPVGAGLRGIIFDADQRAACALAPRTRNPKLSCNRISLWSAS